MTEKLVTIVGSSYFEPISVLLEEIEKYDKGNNNEVQAGYFVNGFASSICLISVVCLESYVMRVRYINKATQPEIDKMSVPAYLKSLYLGFPYEDELYEVYILRDILVHNHLWEIFFSWDDEKGMVHSSSNRRSSGDTKYRKHVDLKTNKTKKLGLNISPIKVGALDVKAVTQAVWNILLFFRKQKP